MKELLTKDGALIVAIDENEQAYLSVLLMELFSEYEITVLQLYTTPAAFKEQISRILMSMRYFVIPQGQKDNWQSERLTLKKLLGPISEIGGESQDAKMLKIAFIRLL